MARRRAPSLAATGGERRGRRRTGARAARPAASAARRGAVPALAQQLLERQRAGGHHAVDAPAQELLPGGARLAVVAEPRVPRVAVLVGAPDVVRRRDVQELAAELVGDRQL